MNSRYPDRPKSASDGEAFAELCVRLHLELMGEDVGYYRTKHDQITIGESAAGIEFKHLQKSDTGRLHIETRERTSLQGQWFASGIFAHNNTKRYCCGNADDIWVFDVEHLRKRAVSCQEWYDHPTIHSMILHKRDALSFYLYRFQRKGDVHILIRPGFVGYDAADRFVHYCHCGAWGAFGFNVALCNDRLGTWHCREHRSTLAR